MKDSKTMFEKYGMKVMATLTALIFVGVLGLSYLTVHAMNEVILPPSIQTAETAAVMAKASTSESAAAAASGTLSVDGEGENLIYRNLMLPVGDTLISIPDAETGLQYSMQDQYLQLVLPYGNLTVTAEVSSETPETASEDEMFVFSDGKQGYLTKNILNSDVNAVVCLNNPNDENALQQAKDLLTQISENAKYFDGTMDISINGLPVSKFWTKDLTTLVLAGKAMNIGNGTDTFNISTYTGQIAGSGMDRTLKAGKNSLLASDIQDLQTGYRLYMYAGDTWTTKILAPSDDSISALFADYE